MTLCANVAEVNHPDEDRQLSTKDVHVVKAIALLLRAAKSNTQLTICHPHQCLINLLFTLLCQLFPSRLGSVQILGVMRISKQTYITSVLVIFSKVKNQYWPISLVFSKQKFGLFILYQQSFLKIHSGHFLMYLNSVSSILLIINILFLAKIPTKNQSFCRIYVFADPTFAQKQPGRKGSGDPVNLKGKK